ncbi:Chemotaxis protein PomA [compost metagenome]
MSFGVVVLALFVLAMLAMQGPSVSGLWSSHAAVVVIGGTFTATLLSFPTKQVLKIPRLIIEAIRAPKLEVTSIVATLIRVSDRLRAGGVNALHAELKNVKDPFLKRGLQYIAEGFDSKEITDLLEAEMIGIRGRHRNNINVFETLGGYAPTLGIMGTVMSMVAIMGNLENPEALGPEIGHAMVATLYGVASANLLFLPIATKLKKLSEEELRLRWIMIEIVLAMHGGASPRTIRERLKASLPPETRKLIQDSKGKGGKKGGTGRLETASLQE